jgi:hypothetical protein
MSLLSRRGFGNRQRRDGNRERQCQAHSPRISQTVASMMGGTRARTRGGKGSHLNAVLSAEQERDVSRVPFRVLRRCNSRDAW